MSQIEPCRHGFGKSKGEQGRLSVHQRKVPPHGHGDIVFQTPWQGVAVIQTAIENVVVNIAEDPSRLIDFPGLAGGGGAMDLAVLIKRGVYVFYCLYNGEVILIIDQGWGWRGLHYICLKRWA